MSETPTDCSPDVGHSGEQVPAVVAQEAALTRGGFRAAAVLTTESAYDKAQRRKFLASMMCPHCGLTPVPLLKVGLTAVHEFEAMTCPGSEQNPRNALADRRPLWKDENR